MTTTALIIGGGIGGLATGIALQRAGIRVQLFERTQELREVGAGLSLWPNATRALRHLSLGDAIEALSVPQISAGIRSRDGNLLVEDSTQRLDRVFGAPTLVAHRAELQQMLFEALGAENIRLNAPFTSFAHTDDGIVAHFADGSQAHGDLLIGADGLNSTVRAQLHGIQQPRYAGYTAWRAVVHVDHRRLTPGETWGAGARFGQVPMSGGRVYWFAAKNAPEGTRSPNGECAELLRTFRGWHAPIEDLIAVTDEAAIVRNDVYDRPPLPWRGAGRVTLLGDAAHPMTPNLGQGACQALEDAVILARCLQATHDLSAALRRYEAQRIPRTSRMIRQSRYVGAVGQWQHPVAVRARTVVARHILSRIMLPLLQQVIGDAV